jgi:Proteasome assembly chaperone 4
MGPFVVAMPKADYKGAFSSQKASSSKLISQNEMDGGIQNEAIASQKAERLALQLDMAIFVSCNLEVTPSLTGCEGVMERQMLRSRAGALAEKEVCRILLERKGQAS